MPSYSQERITYDKEEFDGDFENYRRCKCQKYINGEFKGELPIINTKKMIDTISEDDELAYWYWLAYYCPSVAEKMIDKCGFAKHMKNLRLLDKLTTFKPSKKTPVDKRKLKQVYIIFIGSFHINGVLKYVFKIGKTEKGYQARFRQHARDIIIPDINVVEVYQVDEPMIVEQSVLKKFEEHKVKSKYWLKDGKRKKRELLGITNMNVLSDIMSYIVGMQKQYNTSDKISQLKQELLESKREVDEVNEKLEETKREAKETKREAKESKHEAVKANEKIEVIRHLNEDLREAIKEKDIEKISELQELLSQMVI